MTDKEKIADKIRKLLALANSNTEPHEAALALDMARRMIADHDVTDAELVADQEKIETLFFDEKIRTRLTEHEVQLATACLEHFDCVMIVSGFVRMKRFMAVGRRVDIVTARYAFDYLRRCMESGARRFREAQSIIGANGLVSRRKMRRYREGFALGVGAALRGLRDDFESAGTTGTAAGLLVLNRKAAVDALVDDITKGQARKAKCPPASAALMAGYHEGARAQLHKGVVAPRASKDRMIAAGAGL